MAFKKFTFANKTNKPKEFIPGKDDSPTDESDDLLNANHSPIVYQGDAIYHISNELIQNDEERSENQI